MVAMLPAVRSRKEAFPNEKTCRSPHRVFAPFSRPDGARRFSIPPIGVDSLFLPARSGRLFFMAGAMKEFPARRSIFLRRMLYLTGLSHQAFSAGRLCTLPSIMPSPARAPAALLLHFPHPGPGGAADGRCIRGMPGQGHPAPPCRSHAAGDGAKAVGRCRAADMEACIAFVPDYARDNACRLPRDSAGIPVMGAACPHPQGVWFSRPRPPG